MKQVMQRNQGYKVVALLLAILLWLWVSYQGAGKSYDKDQTLTIPLVVKNVPVNSMVMTKLPSVRVTLKGVNPSVTVKDIYAYVDLTDSTPGDHEFQIKMDPLPNTTLVDMVPGKVKLKIDTIKEKTVPVQVTTVGTPGEGKELGNPVMKPSSIIVRGPNTLLSLVEKALVEVNVSGATETVQVSRPVALRNKAGQAIYGPDPSMESLTSIPGSVDVIVPIMSEGLNSKTIPLRVTTKGSPDGSKRLNSTQIVPDRVQVFGNSEALRTLESLSLGTVDIGGLKEDKSFEFSTDKLSLPKGVSFGTPAKFTVIVKLDSAPQNKTLNGISVSVKNLPAELQLEEALVPVDITVKGQPEVLANLKGAQVTLWVDAAGLAAGKHEDSKLFWQLPAGVEMVNSPGVTFSLKGKTP